MTASQIASNVNADIVVAVAVVVILYKLSCIESTTKQPAQLV